MVTNAKPDEKTRNEDQKDFMEIIICPPAL